MMKFIALLFVIFVVVKARQINSSNNEDAELKEQIDAMVIRLESITNLMEQLEGNIEVGRKLALDSRPDIKQRLTQNKEMVTMGKNLEDLMAKGTDVQKCEKVINEKIDEYVENAWKELNANVENYLKDLPALLQPITEKRNALKQNLVDNLEEEVDMCKKDDKCNLKTKYPLSLNELFVGVVDLFQHISKFILETENYLNNIRNDDENIKEKVIVPITDCVSKL